ncbi:M48 family metallopeptidase [Kiloniella spongiae]|uniref:M48 family metallopeptidase n=1 Tax=Kiloniella spongiae TaxID=1489064 RepID=UPI000699AF8C|nr:SprT family zinc-dependent metalloprotease [Kiloniella spongiae]
MVQKNAHLDIGGQKLEVIVQPHPTSRKLSLRLVMGKAAVKVVCPPNYPIPDILNFVERQKDWITDRLDKQSPPVSYEDGTDIPILGRLHKIVRITPGTKTHSQKGAAWLETNQLYIKSHSEHVPRRVRDFLKQQVRFEIDLRAQEKAAKIDKKIAAIRIKDTTSRWGSCSTKGNLNFSWRLIFSPEEVLDYVVAHEVAHLEHMNHSPEFWALVDQLTDARKSSQKWLKLNGNQLLAYS